MKTRILLPLLFAVPALLAQDPAAAKPAPEAVPAPAPAPVAATPSSTTPPTLPAPAAKPAAAPLPKLDAGLLDPAWFGGAVSFTKSEEVDFFWVKPNTAFSGHTIWMKLWEDPALLQKGRDGKDNAKATVLTDSISATLRGALAGAFNGKTKFSRTEGDLELIGRVVDCNAGSTAAKWLVGFGAGQENVTFDLKILDANTKELLVAVHHRTISGTYLSNIDSKLVKWAEKFGIFLAQKTLK